MRMLAIVLVGCATSHASPRSCPRDTAIVVDTAAHDLTLCEAGRAVETLSVAIGGNGTGKTKEGDRKTPLGTYSLADPRPSEKFHQFILIGYPTAEQTAQGLTGGAVGIHGPSRKYGWFGRVRNWFDWTDGCIAVGTDEAIDRVAAWVTRTHARRVEIR